MVLCREQPEGRLHAVNRLGRAQGYVRRLLVIPAPQPAGVARSNPAQDRGGRDQGEDRFVLQMLPSRQQQGSDVRRGALWWVQGEVQQAQIPGCCEPFARFAGGLRGQVPGDGSGACTLRRMAMGGAHQSHQRDWGARPRSSEEPAEGLDRRDELEWVRGESAEAVVAVEGCGLVTLGVDHQGVDRDLGS